VLTDLVNIQENTPCVATVSVLSIGLYNLLGLLRAFALVHLRLR
jgi:hypothetical protein